MPVELTHTGPGPVSYSRAKILSFDLVLNAQPPTAGFNWATEQIVDSGKKSRTYK